MKAKICGVVTARTRRELEETVREAERLEVDLAEIRIDHWRNKLDLRSVRKLTALPLIATNRPSWEGGAYGGGEEGRRASLLSAASSGFEYVDIELKTEGIGKIIDGIRQEGSSPIVSSHNFSSTPGVRELYRIFLEERRVCAEVCKIVTMAESFKDNLVCLQALGRMARVGRAVCFCMGSYGVPSRILAPLFGSAFTYASLRRGGESAPGQLTVEELREAYTIMGGADGDRR